METVTVDKKEFDTAKKYAEAVKRAKRKYNKKFKSYCIQIPKNEANLLEQTAIKLGYPSARQLIYKVTFDIIEEHKQHIEITPF